MKIIIKKTLRAIYIKYNKFYQHLYVIVVISLSSIWGHSQVPSQHELHTFADTLAGRQILYMDSLPAVHRLIDQGYIKSGTIDFLPYCKNANIFSLSAYTKTYLDPQKYLVAIYADMVKTIPGFRYPTLGVCTHFFDSSTCSQIKGLTEDGVPIESPLPTNKWQLHVAPEKSAKAPQPIKDCDICITSETELVKIINDMLTRQKIPYQLALVPNYITDAGQRMASNDSVFGIICLSREQGYRFPDENPWLSLPVFFQGYITRRHVEQAIQKYQSIGLFAHLEAQQIRISAEKALSTPYTNFNDILALFPGIVYPEKTFSMKYYQAFTKQLTAISHHQFNPTALTFIRDSQDPERGYISFILNGKPYKTEIMGEESWAYYEYLRSINLALSESKIDGQFALLYNTEQNKEQGIHSSFIYLTKEQSSFLKEENLVSVIPGFYVEFESWHSFENDVKESWEAFY